MKPSSSPLISSIVLLFICGISALAQATEPTATPAVSGSGEPPCAAVDERTGRYDFADITRERDSLIKEIGNLTGTIETLNNRIPFAPTQSQVDEYKKRKEAAAKTPNKDGAAIAFEPFFDETEPTKEALAKQRQEQEAQLKESTKELKCFDLKISKINTPEQYFKTTMSTIFAALIGLVIAGFFTLAWRDDVMRRAIFSSQTGIQFLTLFSIVIAIILFGITGILQDKELAALLGGLSGYILGRVSGGAGSPALPNSVPPASPTAPTPAGDSPSGAGAPTAVRSELSDDET